MNYEPITIRNKKIYFGSNLLGDYELLSVAKPKSAVTLWNFKMLAGFTVTWVNEAAEDIFRKLLPSDSDWVYGDLRVAHDLLYYSSLITIGDKAILSLPLVTDEGGRKIHIVCPPNNDIEFSYFVKETTTVRHGIWIIIDSATPLLIYPVNQSEELKVRLL